jgi:hypothetical protein
VISDLGYSDFPKYLIGHSGYILDKKESEKAEIFRKPTYISKYTAIRKTRGRYPK